MFIQTAYDRPVIFRTVGESVYSSSISDGSIWLRSSQYYRNIEDAARKDVSEGVNGTRTSFPLRFNAEGGPAITLEGTGSVGCEIIPHYIFSMHGAGISEEIRNSFGNYTFGIKCILKLSAEILYQASKQITVTGYRYGQVSYQHTALTISQHSNTAAINIGDEPPEYIKSINTDVLRKDPVEPFIRQDEWRIAIFSPDIVGNDPNMPLKINVDPDHFFEYIKP